MLRTSKGRRPHSGSTLVEMLVVISIIAILASITLPAIYGVKRVAQAAACRNNLKNLAQATMQFEIAHRKLPASRTFWNDAAYRATGSIPQSWTAASAPSQTLTWVHELLPYIERSDMRVQVEGQLASKGSVQLVAGKIALLICPLDPNNETVSTNSGTQQKYSHLSYGANGGVLDNLTMANPQFGFDWPQNGLFDNRLKGTTKSGPEAQLKIYESSLWEIPDGSTNTLLYIENHNLEEWNFAPSEVNVCVVWDDLNYPQPRQSLGQNSIRDKSDTLWNLFQQGPNAALPYARPFSYHVNGFNVAFADGRVAFISDTIAYEVYMHLMTSAERKYQPAGVRTLAPPPLPPALTSNAVQNVFQGSLDDGSY